MPDEDELLLTLAKGLIGSAANLALPGLGALVTVGFTHFKGTQGNFSEQIAKELLDSFRAVAPRKVTLRARATALLSRSEKKEAHQLLAAGADLGSVMRVATRAMENSGNVDLATLPKADQQSWAALGEAQMAMARSPAFVPGVWQDEFAALLQTICEEQLEKDGSGADRWRQLIGIEERDKDLSGAPLTDLMRTVTRVFAARMAANPVLKPLVDELRQSDRNAMQYALLWRLDQQRQSLQLIAAAICALLVALGIEVEVTQ
jgi:hypothetical protein